MTDAATTTSREASLVDDRPPHRRRMLGGNVRLFGGNRWMVALVIVDVFIALELIARLIGASSIAPPVVWYDASAQQRIELIEQRDPDVLFVGTSMAWQAFVPGEFTALAGETLNVGLAGAVPEVSGPWLSGPVLDRATPRTVVWGLSSLDFSESYGEQPLEAWEQSVGGRSDLLARMDRWASGVSEAVRIRRILRRPDELWGERARDRRAEFDSAAATTGPDGERRDFTEDRSATTAAIMRTRLAEFRIDQNDIDALVLAAEHLRERNIELVLVELPVPPSFVALHPGGDEDHDKVGATIATIADLLGTRYLDLSRGFGEEDFVDFNHLSADGARLFSQLAAEEIFGEAGSG